MRIAEEDLADGAAMDAGGEAVSSADATRGAFGREAREDRCATEFQDDASALSDGEYGVVRRRLHTVMRAGIPDMEGGIHLLPVRGEPELQGLLYTGLGNATAIAVPVVAPSGLLRRTVRWLERLTLLESSFHRGKPEEE